MVKLPSDWTFFGLTPKYRLNVYDQIFDLTYYGKGFSYSDIIDMPVYLRVYYINKINKIFEDRNKAQEKSARQAAVASKRASPPKFRK